MSDDLNSAPLLRHVALGSGAAKALGHGLLEHIRRRKDQDEKDEPVPLEEIFQRLKDAWKEHADKIQDEENLIDVSTGVLPAGSANLDPMLRNPMLRRETGAEQAWKRNTAATEARGVDQLKHVQNVIVDVCSGFELGSVSFSPTGEKLVHACGFIGGEFKWIGGSLLLRCAIVGLRQWGVHCGAM